MRRVADLGILLAFAGGMAAWQFGLAANDDQAETQGANQAAQSDAGLVIENESELPPTFPHGTYELRFRAQGGISALHWRLEKGGCPPGMKLEDNGLLHGL